MTAQPISTTQRFLFNESLISPIFSDQSDIVMHHGLAADFLPSIPSNSVRLIVTSPPYNIGKQYETRVAIKQYVEEQDQVIDEFVRVLADDGSLCWQIGNYVEDAEVYPLDCFYYHLFKKRGLKLRNRIVWHFEHGLHASLRFSGRYETLLWFTKSDQYVFNLDQVRVPAKYPGKRHFKGPKRGQPSGNPLGKNPSDFWTFLAQEWEGGVWEIPNVKANHPEKTTHPCQFPIELVERCVLAFTNESDWVFDPYSGVGSSLIAAVKNGRRAMGCEKELPYVELARMRMKCFFEASLKIRPIGTPVFQPTGREKVSQVPEEWKAS